MRNVSNPDALDRLLGMGWLVPLIVALGLAPFSGGYFPQEWAFGGALVFCALVLVLAHGPSGIPSREALVAAGAAACLGCFQLASMVWASEPGLAPFIAVQTLVYAAALALVIWTVRARSAVNALALACFVVVSAVCAYALLSRVIPHIAPGDTPYARLATWLSYWNALGALAAVGAILGLALMAHPAMRWRGAAGVALLVAVDATVLSLTESRGALAAGTVGLALAVALASRPLTQVAVALAVLSPSLAVASQVGSYPSVPAVVGAVVASSILGCGGVVLFGGKLERVRPTRALLAITGLSLAGLAAVIVVMLGGLTGIAARVSSAFSSFTSFGGPTAGAGAGAGRILDIGGSGRWQEWVVAAKQGADSPLWGTGAGGFRFAWAQMRMVEFPATNAHSSLLEAWGDTGLIGVLLVALPTILLVGVIVRSRLGRRLPDDLRVPFAACNAAFGVIAIQALADWTWQVPTVMLVGMVLMGGAFAAARLGGRTQHHARQTHALLAVAWTMILAATLTLLATSVLAADARASLARGELRAAERLSRIASAAIPIWTEPLLTQARTAVAVGDSRRADASYEQAIELSPRSSALRAEWASYLIDRGHNAPAGLLLAAARRNDPLNRRLSLLDDQIQGVIP